MSHYQKDRRCQELRARLKEARKARKQGLPGENPKKLLGALRARERPHIES